MSTYMENALNAPDSDRSYSQAWGVIHDRFAREDAERNRMLEAVVRAEIAKGRGTVATRGRPVFTDEQVRDIRRRVKRGQTLSAVACDYRVSRETISKIATGKRYGSVA